MEKELTQEQRIEVIRRLVKNAKSIQPTQSVEDFVADVRSQEVFEEFGMLGAQREDVEDESQFLFTDSAEEIDEEDEDFGLSPEMRDVVNHK